eukprot:6190927-Pleurochrysis_carterae.AAC.2
MVQKPPYATEKESECRQMSRHVSSGCFLGMYPGEQVQSGIWPRVCVRPRVRTACLSGHESAGTYQDPNIMKYISQYNEVRLVCAQRGRKQDPNIMKYMRAYARNVGCIKLPQDHSLGGWVCAKPG